MIDGVQHYLSGILSTSIRARQIGAKSALWLIGMTHRKRASKSGTECARKMHDKEWLLFDQGWNEERVWRVVFTVRDYPDRFDRAQPDLSGPSELVIVAKNCCIPPNQVATRFSSKLNKEILFWEIWLVNQWESSSEHSRMWMVGFLIEFSITDWLKPRTNQNQFKTPSQMVDPFFDPFDR